MRCNAYTRSYFGRVTAVGPGLLSSWKDGNRSCWLAALSTHRSLGESRWRPGGDTMEVYGGHAGRQTVQRVLGADKSSPHRPDEGFTSYWPARTARPQSLPTLNGLVEKESHKLADEQRWGRLCPLPPPPLSCSLTFYLFLSFTK